jgi:hypothetical protein
MIRAWIVIPCRFEMCVQVQNIGKTCRYQMHTTMEALFDELVGEMCELRELASREVGYTVPLQEAADRRKADTNAVWSAISNDAYWPWMLRTNVIKDAVMRELRSDTMRLLSAHRKEKTMPEEDANMDVSAVLRELYSHKLAAQRRYEKESKVTGVSGAQGMNVTGSPGGKFYGAPPRGRAGGAGGKREGTIGASPQRAGVHRGDFDAVSGRAEGGEDDGFLYDDLEAGAEEDDALGSPSAEYGTKEVGGHGGRIAGAAMARGSVASASGGRTQASLLGRSGPLGSRSAGSGSTAPSSAASTPKGRAAAALYARVASPTNGGDAPSAKDLL